MTTSHEEIVRLSATSLAQTIALDELPETEEPVEYSYTISLRFELRSYNLPERGASLIVVSLD